MAIDRVAKHLIAILDCLVLDVDGVARAVHKTVLIDDDRVVLHVALIAGVGTDFVNYLRGLSRATAPNKGAGRNDGENDD